MDSKLLALVATLVLAATVTMNTSHTDSFESYKAKHGKSYATQEEHTYRQAIFMMNSAKVSVHNADETQTYKKGINQFTDLTNEEFASIYLRYKPKNVTPALDQSTKIVGDVNWVTAGKVQKVKDQGQCGSCWAFSTVASSESLKAINGGDIGDFSEQQLVDCSTKNSGCNGGLMDYGFEYFVSNGICTEDSYPYTAKDGTCAESSCTKDSFKISGYTDVDATTDALKAACDKQPVSIAVDATNWSPYTSGIFSDCSTSLDHGVLLAGYTSTYWLVKNSWATTWGEDGYIRLAPGNTCGLANSASYPK